MKSEPYLDNDLSRLLIKRALLNPARLGHLLFWHLRGEIEREGGGWGTGTGERFRLMLEEYLKGCGVHR